MSTPAGMVSAMPSHVLCVALNPAIDQTIELSGLTPGAVNRATHAQQDAGGKGVNVASCLADHGAATAVIALLGRENPALFESLFNAKRIASHSLYLDGSTRINIKLVDTLAHETTDINLPGPQLDSAQIEACIKQILQLVSDMASSLKWLVLSGSIPPAWPADTYARLVRHAHGVGVRVLLDTSGAPLGAALAAGPDIVKPNRDELAAHLGRALGDHAATLAAARELLAQHSGIARLVVSMGSEGALFVTRNEAVLAHPLKVTVSSSVGAGDAMVAGLIAAELDGLSLADSARLATAFAAGKLSRLGPHLPAAAEVQALAQQVVLAQLNEAAQ
jgi:1-phosphofructokinase